MTGKKKVALGGASGNVGRILRVELQKRGVDLRSAGGTQPLQPLHEGEDVMHGDLKEPAVVDRLLAGVDVPWPRSKPRPRSTGSTAWARDDAQAMQFLVPGWRFDPKRPCIVR